MTSLKHHVASCVSADGVDEPSVMVDGSKPMVHVVLQAAELACGVHCGRKGYVHGRPWMALRGEGRRFQGWQIIRFPPSLPDSLATIQLLAMGGHCQF